MKQLTIAAACSQAADLIVKDGFIAGSGGWFGFGGWCIEGALARAYGIETDVMGLSKQINATPAANAIRDYLGWPGDLCGWNDNSGRAIGGAGVVRVLKEVAALHDRPVSETAGAALAAMAEATRELKSKMEGFAQSTEVNLTNLTVTSWGPVFGDKPVTDFVFKESVSIDLPVGRSPKIAAYEWAYVPTG